MNGGKLFFLITDSIYELYIKKCNSRQSWKGIWNNAKEASD